VKTLAFSLCILVLLPSASKAQGHPVPPARRELQKYQSMYPEEHAAVSQPRVDAAQLQREASELASLAQSIPPDVDRINKGALPKDVLEKLKRIEKISKHLRVELAP